MASEYDDDIIRLEGNYREYFIRWLDEQKDVDLKSYMEDFIRMVQEDE